ncbi:MAG: hypothetical protein ACJ749_11845 [Flavisolibacter sp.]
MKKSLLFVALLVSSLLYAQQREETEKKGFKKENLFTGGSISLSFFNNSFLIGANPVFGYSLTKWADFGIVGNYTYTAYHDYYTVEDKLHQSVYGGGVFTRLFPVRFLFAQAQIEHNWIHSKYIDAPGGLNGTSYTLDGNSLLVGAGYTTGRDPDAKNPYGYLAILFDVLKESYSPYRDVYNRAIPIIRAGFNVPLFQGGRSR